MFVRLCPHRDDAVFVCKRVHTGSNANVWIYVYVSACDYQCLIVIDFIGDVMDQENLTVCMSTPIPRCIMHTHIIGIHTYIKE